MRGGGDAIMLLKVVCQVCGKTGVIDPGKPVGRFPRWERYRIKDLVDADILGAFENYEIWICDECHEKASTFCGLSMDETGEYYEDWEIDWEKFSEMVRKSLEERGD